MAGHNDIKVGSTDWVIRIAGEDVSVKVMEKKQKASGRGYEFRVRRLGPDGRVFGRSLMRGSGALRKPGEPVKGFGGKAPAKKPRPPARRKTATKARPAPKAPKPTPKPTPKPAPKPRSNPFTSSSPSSPKLTSLRGRGRSRSSSATKTAPARPSKKEQLQFRVPNDLVKKVMRKLEKLPKEADTFHIRNAVAEILAAHERSKYFPAHRR